jgi:hypothetical protein
MPRIGIITGTAEADPQIKSWVAGFTRGLDELGWHPGRNVRLDFHRGDGDMTRIRGHAAELVQRPPDVVLSIGTASTGAGGLMAYGPRRKAFKCRQSHVHRRRGDRMMSASGTSRHFAATQQFSRFRRDADIQRAADKTGFMSTRPSSNNALKRRMFPEHYGMEMR